MISNLDIPVYNDFQDYVFVDVLEVLVNQRTIKQFVKTKIEHELSKQFKFLDFDPFLQEEMQKTV